MPRRSASISRAAPIRASASNIPFAVSMRTIRASRASALTTISCDGSEGMSGVTLTLSLPIIECCSLSNALSCCSLGLRGVRDGVATRGKKLDRSGSATVDRQVDQCLADHRRELESVSGETGPEGDMLIIGMLIDDEVSIGRERVHAH